MLCCLPTGIPDNPSEQAIKLFRILKILLIFQIVFAILTFFISIFQGLLVMIGCLVLFLITCSKNWCGTICYIVLCFMDGVSTIMACGNYLAEHGGPTGGTGVIVTILLLKISFYVVSIYYTFLTYRELKGLFIENMEEASTGMLPQFIRQYPGQPEPDQPPIQPQVQPFSGQGYRLG